MKFRKKPIIIEAEQWFPGVCIEGMQDYIDPWTKTLSEYRKIDTIDGIMLVKPGDWIITGVEGEKDVCKDSIFRATYEPIED